MRVQKKAKDVLSGTVSIFYSKVEEKTLISLIVRCSVINDNAELLTFLSVGRYELHQLLSIAILTLLLSYEQLFILFIFN